MATMANGRVNLRLQERVTPTRERRKNFRVFRSERNVSYCYRCMP